MITATLMEVANNAESQVANNLKSNAQSPTTAAGSPAPNDDSGDDKDSYDDNNFNFTKREKNEAKRQFSSNKKFRDYFHREYKPSEKHNVNGKNNPDLRDEQITEAYKEWKSFYGDK